MKFIFLAGGLVGFATATIAGWSAERPADSIFLSGTVGAIVGAVLFRWFWGVLLRGMREAFVARQRAAETPIAEPKKTK